MKFLTFLFALLMRAHKSNKPSTENLRAGKYPAPKPFSPWRALLPCALAAFCVALLSTGVSAVSLQTGRIDGLVLSPKGIPVANARVRAVSASETYQTLSDQRGHFEIADVLAGTYTLTVAAADFDSMSLAGITVQPAVHIVEVVHLKYPKEIASITALLHGGVHFSEATDSYVVNGEAARGLLTGTPSGLGRYSAGTVLGTVSNLPGIQQDQFSDIIARGSKVYDSAFDYDGVPFPQELISSPGGTTFGSPLTTTGIAYTSVTQAGFTSGGDNAFGAIVNQIPITGAYPEHMTLTIGTNISDTNSKLFDFQETNATVDQRIRWAIALSAKDEQLPIGDGTQFYTGVAGGMGLDYSAQSTFAGMANLHVKIGSKDDLELLGLIGVSHFAQYGQPYPGLIYANANGLNTIYPDANPYAAITQPGEDAGNYSLQKLQYARNRERSTTTARISRGQNYGKSAFVVGSDLTFPLGFNSFDGDQYYSAYSAAIDIHTAPSDRQEIGYGTELRSIDNQLWQVIPIIDDATTSNVRTNSYTAWFYDRDKISPHFNVLGSLRLIGAHEMRGDGKTYDISQIDPHVGLAYNTGRYSFTANYDRISQLPLPTAVQRIDSGASVPFVPLGVERGNHYTFALEHGGLTSFRLTYWMKLEKNRIDILPAGFAVQSSSTSVGASPSAIGLPENLSQYRAHGVDLAIAHGSLSLIATYALAQTLDPSQYNLNQINPALLASGQLIPQGFFPTLTAKVQYAWHRGGTTVTPNLSYESGYPYGNGKKVWIFGSNGQPIQVNNDNHVNPGYAYYFLQNPALQYDSDTNPYIADLGTPEGNTPYTLHAPPRTFVGVRVDQKLTNRFKVTLVVNNLLNFTKPVQYISNPYMPGPPGYEGGNPLIASWMGQQWGTALGQYRGLPYELGNGIPTLDGYHPEFGPQFNYGTSPYVAGAFPYRRSMLLTVSYDL